MEESTLQKSGGIDSFTLKVIAIVGMTMDHVGIVFGSMLPKWLEVVLYAPGGLTFPIMAYLLTVGYRHTRSFRGYALRLLTYALVSLLPFMWATRLGMFNVLFTLLIGLVAIYLYDHMKNRVLFWVVFVLLCLATLLCDWNLIGVPMVLCYHAIQNPKAKVVVPIIFPWMMMVVPYLMVLVSGVMGVGGASVGMVGNMLPSLAYCIVGCTATIPLLLHYNGKRGRPMKHFFYIYYPAHLAVLALARWGITGKFW